MGKKYYIKKTSLNTKEVLYAVTKSPSGFMTYAVNPVSKLIVDEEDLKTTSFNVRLYEAENIEFEEIKERYLIANFHPTDQYYTYLATNYLFCERVEIYSSYDLTETKGIWNRIRKDYQFHDNIRIIIERDNSKYDYKTGLKFDDINLYLRLEEMRNELLKITAKYPIMYRNIAKEINTYSVALKQQGIGANDRDI